MIATLEQVAKQLSAHGVRFIVIGGWAAIVHGSARSTNDVDVVYAREPENLERLAAALAPWKPYLRGAPPGLPFVLDARTLKAGLNFTLTTPYGDLDLLGEVAGDGTYDKLISFSQAATVAGVTCQVVTLEKLIHLKRCAGRPKDLDAIAELEALLEERRRLDGGG